jgi:hypothetical protein
MVTVPPRQRLLWTGVAIGVAYGVLTRLAFGAAGTLASVTFLFITPAVLGAIPLLIANDETLRAYRSLIFLPWIVMAGLFLVFAALRIEGLMCLMILAAPFALVSLLAAFVVRAVRLRRKARRGVLPALVLGPFLLSPIEASVRSPSAVHETVSSVTVRAPAPTIWEQLIRVPEIPDSAYAAGAFNRMGIPRPVEARLFGEGPGARREGRFAGGLRLDERIVDWVPHRRVSFSILVDTSTIRPVVFDRHVLTGGYFEFVDAAYEIEPLGDGTHALRLISRYRLTSKLNFYGRLWGDAILRDFQSRLLAVLAARSEVAARNATSAG